MLNTSPLAGQIEASMEIDALHQRCGVYTQADIVETILDHVRWVETENLATKRLLEPAAGDGAFVVIAAKRLLSSCHRHSLNPSFGLLGDSIVAYELHPAEAQKARLRIAAALVECGLSTAIARRLSERWVRNGDFLLADVPESFTHVVGNPPYIRWSNVPVTLRRKYEARLPTRMTKGDLFLSFLDIGISRLASDGVLGFICSDRWKFMAFAEQFRNEILPTVEVVLDKKLQAESAYLRMVDTYPAILVLRRREFPIPQIRRQPSSDAITLAEAGYEIRVGPALGCKPAFVLGAEQVESIESDLLAPWLDSTEIREGRICWSGSRILVMHDEQGKLRSLDSYPKAEKHLEKYKAQLEKRVICRSRGPWYRPIDRILASVWKRPKLLVPELAKIPRIALDESGSIPSHGVYAIFSPDDNLSDLYDRLKDGRLAEALSSISPQVKGGYVRCYRRFLDKITL